MYKVLIVDDEPFILEGMKKLIDWQGLGLDIVHTCYDALDALSYLSRHSVHILITDVRMPDMSGLELIINIKKMNINTPKFIILSGYNDFSYTKEAVLLGIENYLLKPISENEMVSTLKTTTQKIESELFRQIEFRQGQNIIRDNILHRWLMGNIEKKELLERAAFLNIVLPEANYFTVHVIPITAASHETERLKITNKNLLQFAVHNICNEITSIHNNAITYCDPSGKVIIVYSQVNSEIDYPILRNELNECIVQINQLLGIDVFIMVGSVQYSLEEAHFSYTHAKKMEDYQLVLPPNTVLFFHDIQPDSVELKNQLNINFKKLHELIVGRNREETIQMVRTIYNKFMSLNLNNPKYLRELFMEILFQIKFVIRMHSPNSEILLHDFEDLVQNTLEKPTLDQLQVWIEELLQRTFDFLEHRNEEQSPFIQRILSHIERCYMEDINLSTLAQEYHIHSVYLGYLFKKETGEPFNNYLNRIRIGKAVELLRQYPAMKAVDVAQQVGYVNPNYFYTVFKKMTGISPTHFRKD
ncbi:response regulator transcription factor [Cohnella silvisoli]|uniref:Response regulator n=1 Tax=Cohnella silvisoli TaxID=2873699 RepID=A0ABV1KT13_9BACL|nr:response regulator [Cohnella silvisoli]MCD9021490.1 response regulator [Cohnella silvisoli]